MEMKQQTIVTVTTKGLDLIEEVRAGNLGFIFTDGVPFDKAIIALNLDQFVKHPRSFLRWKNSRMLPTAAYANWLINQGYIEVEEKELPDIAIFEDAFKSPRKPRQPSKKAICTQSKSSKPNKE